MAELRSAQHINVLQRIKKCNIGSQHHRANPADIMPDINLSPLIKIDTAATENEHIYTHFLTRPMSASSLPAASSGGWSGIVYTSEPIRRVMRRSWPHRRHRCRIRTLYPFSREQLRLSDGSELQVVLLPTESADQNVMYLFELNGQRVFYTGQFTEYASVLRTNWCQLERSYHSDQRIHTAYVDNALVAPTMSVSETCATIRSIRRRHPGHILRLPLPAVGYGDLLVALTREPFSYRVTVAELREAQLNPKRAVPGMFCADKMKADIVVCMEDVPATTDEDYAKFRRCRIVTVLLSAEAPKSAAASCTRAPCSQAYDADRALYVLHYAPHAAPADVLDLVEHLQPVRVEGVHGMVVKPEVEQPSGLEEEAESGQPTGEDSMYMSRGRSDLDALFDAEEVTDDHDNDADDVVLVEEDAATAAAVRKSPCTSSAAAFTFLRSLNDTDRLMGASLTADHSSFNSSLNNSSLSAVNRSSSLLLPPLRPGKQKRQHKKHTDAMAEAKRRGPVQYVDDEEEEEEEADKVCS